MKPYRPCIVAVIVNSKGLILAGERSDKKGVWQLPQGGVDPGETAEVALFRELKEEIGTGDVDIIKRLEERISYDFPEDLNAPITKKFRGQVQDWFLVSLKPGTQPDLSQADGEFSDVSWMEAKHLVKGIVAWKKDAYVKGFKELKLI